MTTFQAFIPSPSYIATQIAKGAITVPPPIPKRRGNGNIRPMLLAQLRPGEILYADWLRQEAAKLGISAHSLVNRILRGSHPHPRRRKLRGKAFAVKV